VTQVETHIPIILHIPNTMTNDNKNKTSNYGSIPPHHSPSLSISSTAEEDGGDTFDVNDILISHDQQNHQRPSLSAISDTHHHSTPSKRSLFDGWLRRDHSIHALTSSITSFRSAVNTTIGLRGDERLVGFLGPTVSCNLNMISLQSCAYLMIYIFISL